MQQNQPLLTQLMPPIIEILGVLLTFIAAYLTKVVAARMKVGAGKDVAIEGATVAQTVVRALAQKIKDPLIEKSRSGTISALDAADLKQLAVAELKDSMSNAALAHIQANSEKPEQVFDSLIEAAVSKAKDATLVVPGKP